MAGCATPLARLHGGSDLHYADYAGPPVERFSAFRLDGWEPVGPDTVLLSTGPSEAYLVKVWPSCRDLRFVERIGVSSTAHEISRLDQVRVGWERCPISEIRPVDLKRMRADRARPRPAA